MKLTHKIEDFYFRIYRIIGRKIIQYSANPRPASLPFITGDGFRNFADHIYDDLQQISDPKSIADYETIFVGDSKIDSFIENIHPFIESKYILITHNGDAPVTAERLERVKEKIIRWYGINVLVSDPKVIPIPLGISNAHYFVCGIISIFKKVISTKVPKKNQIFYAFTISTNPTERQAALDEIKKNKHSVTLQEWRGFNAYLHKINNYKFVLSPPGSSVEGHRTWDTLYIGGVPIVKSSITTDYFKKVGLPILVLQDWSELQNFTEANIATTYTTLKDSENTEPLYIEYWFNKIKKDMQHE